MGRGNKYDDVNWKKNFGHILKVFFDLYGLSYNSFATQYNWSDATVR